jgi:phosphate transport system substrate-binding protein
LLGVEFSKALYGFAGREGFSAALAFDGSRPGLDELKAGRAQLALCVLAPGEEQAVADFERVVVAYHRVVVLLPAAAPVEQLTVAQLAGIFGVGGPLSILEWGGLGAEGEWRAARVAPQVLAGGTGIVAEYFRHVVLEGRAWRPNVGRFDRLADLAASFGGESRAIALAPTVLPAGGPARIAAIAARAGEPAFLPTPQNLHSGDYPLRLPLVGVFRREAADTVRPLLRFLASDDAAAAFEQAQVAPVPAAVRRQRLAALTAR